METPATLGAWLQQMLLPLGIIVGILIAVYVALRISASRRHQDLAREREGVSAESFSQHLERYGFDPIITTSTYRYLQEVQLVKFPILPSDALDEDLGLDSDDIDQTVRELTVALRREPQPGLRHAPLVTVEDLVRHLQALPRIAQQDVTVAA